MFNLEIVTPERKFYESDVEMIILKTLQGEMGILKGHEPMVVACAIGPIKIKKDGEWKEAILSEGFLEVKQDKTIILVDTAEWPEEIDINRANEARKRAEERLQHKLSQEEFIHSRAALARAMTRLKMTRQK